MLELIRALRAIVSAAPPVAALVLLVLAGSLMDLVTLLSHWIGWVILLVMGLLGWGVYALGQWLNRWSQHPSVKDPNKNWYRLEGPKAERWERARKEALAKTRNRNDSP